MLIIKDQDYFDKVCKFAASKGAQHSEWLWERLWYLHTFYDKEMGVEATCPRCDHGFVIGERGKMAGRGRCILHADFAPASFEFVVARRKDPDPWCEEFEFVFNGGLIYHGDQSGWETRDGIIQPGEGVPTFSVNLTTPTNPWGVHT